MPVVGPYILVSVINIIHRMSRVYLQIIFIISGKDNNQYKKLIFIYTDIGKKRVYMGTQ